MWNIFLIFIFAKPASHPLFYLLLLISTKQLCIPLIWVDSRDKEMGNYGPWFHEAYTFGGRWPWVQISTRICVLGSMDTSHKDLLKTDIYYIGHLFASIRCLFLLVAHAVPTVKFSILNIPHFTRMLLRKISEKENLSRVLEDQCHWPDRRKV